MNKGQRGQIEIKKQDEKLKPNIKCNIHIKCNYSSKAEVMRLDKKARPSNMLLTRNVKAQIG